MCTRRPSEPSSYTPPVAAGHALTLSRQGIVRGGAWCADHNKLIDRWPERGHPRSPPSSRRRMRAAACANVAVDLKNWRAVPGRGNRARRRRRRRPPAAANLRRVRTWHSTVPCHPDLTTAFTDVTSVQGGKRTFFHFHGTHDAIGPQHFDLTKTAAPSCTRPSRPVWRRLMRRIRTTLQGLGDGAQEGQAGGDQDQIELCSIPAEELAQLARPCLPHLDCIIVNDYEAGAVAGIATSRDGATDQGGMRRGGQGDPRGRLRHARDRPLPRRLHRRDPRRSAPAQAVGARAERGGRRRQRRRRRVCRLHALRHPRRVVARRGGLRLRMRAPPPACAP